ncbi:GntR family transcriptional regulator [Streptomyces sp. LN590]|uniref:GntR family transcriptional regulator n=1 Tax=Streptomyces sp. LN590 TaxID=3112980 RepID=UPI00372399C5
MLFALEGYRFVGRCASEIAASVERVVGSGELAPGQVLPSMRELAAWLEVNPHAVAAAYRTLRERGVMETAGWRGSRVRLHAASTVRGSLRARRRPACGIWGPGPDAGRGARGGSVARACGDRRDALVQALMERGIEAHGRSGMKVWVPVSDETGVVDRLLNAGWAVAPGARFRVVAPQGIRLTVSPLAAADLAPLADAVAVSAEPPRSMSYG